MGATIVQSIAFGIAAYVYSKPEVYSSGWAWALLPGVVYVVYSFLDGSELTPQGRYWPAFQKGAFSVLPDLVVGPNGWFSGQIKYDNEEELQNTKQCIFAAFPHGVVSFHHVLMASDSAGFISKFPHLSCHQRRDLAASVCFKIPLWRELLLWLGGVDAGRATAYSVLRNGWSLYILPGGEAEQLLTKHGEHHVYLNRRRGFIKLAIQYGVDLVPVYSFGETDAYETYSFLFGLRWWICKNLRVALPLARGIGPTLWPRRVPLHCVVGTPIRVTQSSNPSDMTVAHLHTRFTTELKALFDKHKAACGHPDAELVVH